MSWQQVTTIAPEYAALAEPWAGRRVLVVCARGTSRSVALAWLLKDFLRADAIAIGAEANSAETIALLTQWAEAIIVVEGQLFDAAPPEVKAKLILCDVGADRYFQGFHPDLLRQYQTFLEQYAADRKGLLV